MSEKDWLSTYAEGWMKGDPKTILEVVADDYILDDPNAGRIGKQDFPDYLNQLKETVSSLRDGESESPFMELSEVVTQQDGDGLTAWCWWTIPGTEIMGSGLIKVGPAGVLSERIAYYTRLS